MSARSFLLLGAEFVGITQILVYIGAIVVLFLFGIMLTRAPIGREVQPHRQLAGRWASWSRSRSPACSATR